MKDPRPVSVLMVAAVSAGLQGGLAVLFAPLLAFLFAVSGAGNQATIEYGMTFAVVAPLLCAASGFLMGAFAGAMFNMFVNPERKRRHVLQSRPQVARAAAAKAA